MKNLQQAAIFHLLLFNAAVSPATDALSSLEHALERSGNEEEGRSDALRRMREGRYDLVIVTRYEDLLSLSGDGIVKIFLVDSPLDPSCCHALVKALQGDHSLSIVYSSKNYKNSKLLEGPVIESSGSNFSEQWNLLFAKACSLNKELDRRVLDEAVLFGDEVDLGNSEVEARKNKIRVCVFLYPIFAQDCFYILKGMGFDVIALPMGVCAQDKLDPLSLKSLVNFNPHFCLSINFYPDLALILKSRKIPYASWLPDIVKDNFIFQSGFTDENNFIFTYSKREQEKFIVSGFKQVFLLPLAANIRRHRPRRVKDEHSKKYSCAISFVGDSITENNYAITMAALIEELKKDTDFYNKDTFIQTIQDYEAFITDLSLADSSVFSPELDTILDRLNRVSIFHAVDHEKRFEIFQYDILDEASSRKRKNIMMRLGTLGDVCLYGDVYWKSLENETVHYRGVINNSHELPIVYNSTKINLNISRLHHRGVLIMRIFDILACGGFLLTDYKPEIEEFFTPGEDLVCYRDADEAYSLAKFYLEYPEKREEIAKNGYRKVKDNHSIQHRIGAMLEKLNYRL